MEIDTTYVPAIITAVSSFTGVIANIIITGIYRKNDKKERKVEQEKEALESYLIPLYIFTSNIESSLRDLLEEEKDMAVLSNYLKRTTMISPEKNLVLMELISYIEDAVHYIDNRNFKKINNSKNIIDPYLIIVDFLKKAYKCTQGKEYFVNYHISFESLLGNFSLFNTAIYEIR